MGLCSTHLTGRNDPFVYVLYSAFILSDRTRSYPMISRRIIIQTLLPLFILLFCAGTLWGQSVGPVQALQFDGVDDYVDVGNDPSLTLTTSFTMEAWVQFTSTAGEGVQTFLSKNEGPGPSNKWVWYYWDQNNRMEFHIFGLPASSVFLASDPWTPTLNQWYHVAVTKNGDAYTFYRDGELDGTASSAISIPPINFNALIGRSEGAQLFNGSIEEVRIWNVTRTTSEIREAMHRRLTGQETGLVAYWHFDEGVGTTTSDATSNDNTGTLAGGPTWITSTAPAGDGASVTRQISTPGEVDFTNADLTMNVNAKTGTEDLVVTRIQTNPPGVQPSGVATVSPQYWIVNAYGGGTITTDLTFSIGTSAIGPGDLATPSNLVLFGRSTTADGSWAQVATASGATNHTATFPAIAGFSQLTVGTTGDSPLVGTVQSIQVAVDTAFGAVGDTLRVAATLTNENTSPVGGLQFSVILGDTVDAHFVGLEDTLSNPGFTVSTTTAGDSLRLVIFSGSGAVIQPGTGIPLATLLYVLDPDSSDLGNTIDLFLGDVEVGDSLGVAFADSAVDGQLQVGIRGDVNLDGRISILDIIRLVRFIVGSSPSPDIGSTAYNIADMNDDGAINVVDLISQVNRILGITQPPPPKALPSPVYVRLGDVQMADGNMWLPVFIDTNMPVAGLQFTIAYDPGGVAFGTPNIVQSEFNQAASYSDGGEFRVVAYSLKADHSLTDGDDPVMLIPVSITGDGTQSATVTYILLATRNGQTVPVIMENSSVTFSNKLAVPAEFSLSEAYPNPFNPSTTISYEVPKPAHVTLVVYNLLGQEVIRLVDQQQQAGRYTSVWTGKNAHGVTVSSGIYVYRMTSGSGFSKASRMILLK
jgi:hypothetical protein